MVLDFREEETGTGVNNVYFTLPSHLSMLSIIVLMFTSSNYVRMPNQVVGCKPCDLIIVLILDCLVRLKGWTSMEQWSDRPKADRWIGEP